MKNQLIALIITAAIVLPACGKTVEKNLTEEQKGEYELTIQEAKEALKASQDLTDQERAEELQKVAVSYERMGQYSKAINYYEEILKLIPSHYVALNNMVAMYEELGDFEKAEEYVVPFYGQYKDNKGLNLKVVKDTIRILVKMHKFDEAQLVLEEYTRNYQSKETQAIISDQFEYIRRFRKAAEDK